MYKYENLEVWQRAMGLYVDLYGQMANCRDFGFKDQITRSALSIPSNIAEGEERESNQESARFLYFAKGSAGELVTQLLLGREVGLLEQESATRMINEARQISRMLASLIKIRKGSVNEASATYAPEEPRT
ncbi:four helix bundle protein [Ferrimonas gelatinilytica]|uniref:Four helix bundle protein n=1 Tax=Ferrimonas gelatinilytica TaxID=1255257 RepID=A0ABP9RSS6_9GAMM